MPYSTGCSTALSNFEAGQNYKDVSGGYWLMHCAACCLSRVLRCAVAPRLTPPHCARCAPLRARPSPPAPARPHLPSPALPPPPADPAVIVSFPVVGDAEGACLLAWTTTPWTLPSNLALCVNAEFDYIRVRDPGGVGCWVGSSRRKLQRP